MTTIINDQEHKIIYVDYQKGIPHSVITKFYVPKATNGAYWRPVYWDFFAENGDLTDVRYFQSGSGGNADIISAPKWIDGYLGHYWIDEKTKFDSEVQNGKLLKKLKLFGSTWGKSKNPFEYTEEVSSYEFCARCGHNLTQCDEHIYVDDNGDKRYIDDNSYHED